MKLRSQGKDSPQAAFVAQPGLLRPAAAYIPTTRDFLLQLAHLSSKSSGRRDETPVLAV